MSTDATILPLLLLGSAKSWEMPQLPSLNTLPPRATLTPFPTAEAARKLPREESPWFLGLDGQWQFKLLGRPEQATWARVDAPDWAAITVPGNWTMQGFGRPHYTNVQMPFPHEPPHVPEDNPTGVYRRRFTVPADWQGRRIVLGFAGCEGTLYVYVNKQPVGLSKDARTPAEFDVTALVQPGADNELLAVVVQWSDASFIEDQDHWWQAGLQREVYLYTTGSPHLQDLAVRGDLSDDLRDGILRVTCRIGFGGESYPGYAIEAQLFDAAGQPVFPEPLTTTVQPPDADQPRAELSLAARIPAVKPWSAEAPNLYTLVVTLRPPAAAEGDLPHHAAVPESVACRVGFRSIAIRDRKLLVNGQPVMIKGVNLHDHHDMLGKTVPRQTMELDVQRMKQCNVNAVRTSHYPKDAYYYDLFDRYGLYVVDEANIEAHAFHRELCRDPRYTAAFVERVRNMVERDKNHPCVIFWSLGNESGYGPNHDAAAGYARGADPTRPLHYEGAIGWGAGHRWDGGQRATDVVCPMYPPIDAIIAWAKRRTDDPRPMILCEYSHAMGNSNGSLADYWAAFERYAGLQGGFIWEWLDHGIRGRDPHGRACWLYGGDFGDEPNDANFVADGIVWPDRTPHPALLEFKHLAQPVAVEPVDLAAGRVRIINKQNFVGLEWLRGEWELTADGVRVRTGDLPPLTMAPGEGLEAALDLAGGAADPAAERFLNFRFYQVADTAWAPEGFAVAWQQLALPHPPARRAPRPPRADGVRADEDAQRIDLQAGEVRALFDKTTGSLAHFGGATNLLLSGPRLNVWRPATDNDGIKLLLGRDPLEQAKPLARWLALALDQVTHELAGIRLIRGRGLPVVEVLHRASGRERWEDFAHRQRFTLWPSGELEVENVVKVSPEMSDLPRVGVTLVLPAELEALDWFGRGPWENYPDRKAAAMVGRYSSIVTDQYVPYIMPQEHGHKSDVRWLTLTSLRGQGLRVAGQPTLGFSASHFTADDLFQARHTCDLQPQPEIYLNLDAAMRGLGTASCGPDTLPRYRLLKSEYRFAYRLTALGAQRY